MNDTIRGLFEFIEKSPTCYHATVNAANALQAAGYRRLMEGDDWNLTPGEGYFLTRNNSSLLAFRMPETVTGFMVAAAHTDSPSFRVKENPELVVEGYTKLDVNKYGGMIFSTWMDRPLSVAGRVMVATEDGVEGRLINLDQDLMVIPNVAIHMDRSINDGKKMTVQMDLMPLLGKGQIDFGAMIAHEAEVEPEQVLSHDLFLYARDKGTCIGPEGELILCPRLDDLMCAYGLLQGFLNMKEPKAVPVLSLFDSEEVGSRTRQGAMSTFLKDVLKRICISSGLGEMEYQRVIAHSMMVSADNAHGVHPNHPEKASHSGRPRMGEGLVVKYGAGYATSGISDALLRQMLKKIGVPVQQYFNHPDIRGGSTLGELSVSQVPLYTVDVGLAQLAMHSACETAGSADTDYLIEAMKTFFAAKITETAPNTFTVEMP